MLVNKHTIFNKWVKKKNIINYVGITVLSLLCGVWSFLVPVWDSSHCQKEILVRWIRDYKLTVGVRVNMLLLPCMCVCVCPSCNRPVTCPGCTLAYCIEKLWLFFFLQRLWLKWRHRIRREVLLMFILRRLSRIFDASFVIARCLWLVFLIKFMSDIFAGWLQFSSCTAGCQSVHLFDHLFDHQPFTYILCITELQNQRQQTNFN